MSRTSSRGLARLKLRFPERREALQDRADRDPAFLGLCEAYECACEAIEHWSRSPDGAAAERVREYSALRVATEQDILSMLS